MISFFDPDAPSLTSYLHSAEYPHLPTLVLAVCLQDSAMVTSACALRTPEAEPAAGQVSYRHGRPLAAVMKSRHFALLLGICPLRTSVLVRCVEGSALPTSGRAVRTRERAHAAWRVVMRCRRPLAGVAKMPEFVHQREGVG